MAEKEQALEVEGVVTQALANTRFRVQIEGVPAVQEYLLISQKSLHIQRALEIFDGSASATVQRGA